MYTVRTREEYMLCTVVYVRGNADIGGRQRRRKLEEIGMRRGSGRRRKRGRKESRERLPSLLRREQRGLQSTPLYSLYRGYNALFFPVRYLGSFFFEQAVENVTCYLEAC